MPEGQGDKNPEGGEPRRRGGSNLQLGVETLSTGPRG